MINISFYKNKSGTPVAVWPGRTVDTESGQRKEGQIYLGKVINRDKLIFWSRKNGYFHFDPDTLKITPADSNDIPADVKQPDGSRRKAPIIVDFGDSYFLDCYIRAIGYDEVIESIKVENRDSLYALLFFYVLEDAANCHAETWYRQNYASYLFPAANIYSQRISDLLRTLGSDQQKRDYLLKHIEYLLKSTTEEVTILIDSTGLPNKCSLPVTALSIHEGQKNIEFRMIALVQKDTGLPLYYEIIPGNIVDISTTMRVMELARQYRCNVSYAIGDAGYCCPATMEKLILSGIEFMTRMNPTYELFPKIMADHGAELEKKENLIRYKKRLVSVVKVRTVIAKDKDTGKEEEGFVFLCRDRQSACSKADHLMSSKQARTMTTEELMAACDRFGIFAIVTTRDVTVEEVLPEYYIRQGIEQYFDFGKNYAKFVPVSVQSMETLKGHMLLAFIATFLVILIKNRLGVVDTHYCEMTPAQSLNAEEKEDLKNSITAAEDENGQKKFYISQDPVASVFRESPSSLFYELRGQKAEIFDDELIPTIPVRKAKDFYEAFRLSSPFIVKREGRSLVPVFNDGEGNHLTKKLAFATRPSITDAKINEKRKKTQEKKARKAIEEAGLKLAAPEASEQEHKAKRGPGRPAGSKNKKTLLREAAEAAAKGKETPLKRKRGRPKGSLNKKTLQREAEAKLKAKNHEQAESGLKENV